MATPAPPAPLPAFNVRILPAGTTLVRVHDARLEGDAFNPCLGRPSRFAPIYAPGGECIPTLYAGASMDCAIYESIFHDIPYDAEDKFVRLSEVTRLAVSELRTTLDLKLAPLNEPDLNRLRRTRAELLDTPASAYTATARWAEAFHAADPGLAGLSWTSRRADPHAAYVLFGDRVSDRGLEVTRRTEIAASAATLSLVRALGERAGVVLSA